MKTIKNGIIKFFVKIGILFKLNFTDLAGRVDTGRIGQFAGLICQTILTYFMLISVIWNDSVDIQRMTILSIVSVLPMFLYTLKDMSGTNGTSYIRDDKEHTINRLKGMRNFFRKNFTDAYGRIYTRRIGQTAGLIALVWFTIWAVLIVLFGDNTELTKLSDMDKLGLFTADAFAPMVLYRLKDISGRLGGGSKEPDIVSQGANLIMKVPDLIAKKEEPTKSGRYN